MASEDGFRSRRARASRLALGLGLAVGLGFALVENLWLILSNELAFEGAGDRALFLLGASAAEALLAGAFTAGVAWIAGSLPPLRAAGAASIAWPSVLLLVLTRPLPWLDGAVLTGTKTITALAGYGAWLLVAGLCALALHRRLRGREDRSVPDRPALSLHLGALALLAATGFGLRLSTPLETPPTAEAAAPVESADSSGADRGDGLRLPAGTSVVLVLVDTLRADHLSYAGYARETSPAVDRLAREGVVFLQAIAQATRTSPSMATLLTGTAPTTHGLVAARSQLDPELITWGEILSAHGYATAAFLANPNVGDRFQFTQGIEHVDAVFDELRHDASVLLPRALKWLGHERRDPFFLWLQPLDPHSPYAAPGSAVDRFQDDEIHRAGNPAALPLTSTRTGGVHPSARLDDARSLADYVARYDAEIRFLDDQLGSFLDALDRLDLPTPPLIVFASDHGESLGDNDYYFSHGDFTYESTAHVPLVFSHPDLPRGLRVEQQVRLIDVLPTVLELLDVPAPPSIEGRSLVPLLRGGSLPDAPAVIFSGTASAVEVAIRDGRHKLIARPLPAGRLDSWMRAKLALWPNDRRESPTRGVRHHLALYDLAEDPAEAVDLAGTRPELEAALEARLVEALQGSGLLSERELSEQHMSVKMRQQLEALGYVEPAE